MKKNYFLTLILTFCFSAFSLGQEMLLNGGFENWTDTTTPSDWSKAENTTQESTEKRTGNYSAKMTGGTKDIAQTINNIVAGDSYTITLWYKVESGDNTDARIWSYWKNSSNSNIDNNDNDTEDAIRGPNNNYLDNNNNVWTKYEATITAPTDASQFYFELRVYGSAVVYWDDLSFVHNTTGTDPTLSIISPSDNQEFDSSVSDVTINFSIANFTLSGDNGSEMSDNTGDGYILGSLVEDGMADGTKNVFDTSAIIESVKAGSTYTITAELVDNAGASLSPKVETSVTFSVKLSCDLSLGTIDTSCDALTSGTDTFSGTIDFTGGNTGIVYTITAPQGVTVGGDNPDSVAEGTITFSGMTEGTDAEITIVGGNGSSCDFSRTLYSPSCISLPISEDFGYADGSLTANPLWDSFSGTEGDLMITSGQALVQHGTPSEDAQIQFAAVSGSVYYAFDFTVVDQGSPIPGSDNEYFAMFKDDGFNYRARLDIVPPTSTGDYSVGISSVGSTADAVWATDFTYGTTYRVTVMYNQDSNIAQLWVDATSDSDTSISGDDEEDPGLSIEGFALRQSDSDLNEGILVDNLRIGTTFAETSLSVGETELDGFSVYPNPVTNSKFTVTSSSIDVKQVSIFNVLGKRVFATTISGTKSDVDVSSISSGLYILKVFEGNSVSTSKLVIK